MTISVQGVATLLLLAGAASTAIAAGDPAAGQQKAAACGACHGPDGNSSNPIWPNLAGQHAEYITKQLQDFQAKRRENAQMSPMAAPLSEQDIADVSAYFASQKFRPGMSAPEQMDLGQRIYRAGNAKDGLPACMACHGPDGAGNPAAAYPALHGQHAEYTAAQLKSFKAEQRANDPNSVMRDIAAKMNNAEIDAVSSYIQGLR